MMTQIPTKSAKIMSQLLNSARSNGVLSGMAEDRMFVKSIICGKAIKFRKYDIKAKGRSGVLKVPKCSLKVVLEEKPLGDWYK